MDPIVDLKDRPGIDLPKHEDLETFHESSRLSELPVVGNDASNLSKNEESDNELSSSWDYNLRPLNIMEFSGQPGPTKAFPGSAKEIDFFQHLFPSELFEDIAKKTNLKAESVQKARGSADNKWHPTSSEEIRAFFGIKIIMGIVVAPTVDLYFSLDQLVRPTGIHEIITRDRLEKIGQYLTVSSNGCQDNLSHVRCVLEAVLPKFKSAYSPHKEVCIDETMVAFSGPFSEKIKNGMKVWMRADPHNGFVNDFEIYTGNEKKSKRELYDRVFRDLSYSVWGKGHHIYCDDAFTSIKLFKDLLSQKTYACGRVQHYRVDIPQLISKDLNQMGEFLVMQRRGQEGLVATACYDKGRTLRLLSTNCSPTEMVTVSRKREDGTRVDFPCPRVVQLHNKHMKGVSRAEEQRTAFGTGKKSTACWKYLWWFIMDVTISNAFVLMKESKNHHVLGEERERTQLEFRTQLAHQLIGGYRYRRKRDLVVERTITQDVLHWPTLMDKRRICRGCSKKNVRREGIMGCEQCQVNLCGSCFKSFHREKHPQLFKSE